MKKHLVGPLVCLAIVLAASLSLAEGIVAEVYRSPHGSPLSFSVDPSDGSCWGVVGTSVIHVDAQGHLLLQYTRLTWPVKVAVNTADGSCWVIEQGVWDAASSSYVGAALVHLSRDGVEVGRANYWAGSVSVDPREGSVWFTALTDINASAVIVHIGADGQELGRITTVTNPLYVSVSPFDGSLWVYDTADGSGNPSLFGLRHLAPDGTLLGQHPGADGTPSVNSTDGSCWVGTYGAGVVYLSANDEVLWTGAAYAYPIDVLVNPADGSCWVQYFPADGIQNCMQSLVHLSADGAELHRLDPPQQWPFGRLAINPADGTLWTGAGFGWAHLAADGSILWQDRGLQRPVAVAIDPANGDYWIAGAVDCGGPGRDPWLAHYDALGNELWRKTRFTGPDGNETSFYAIDGLAVDPVDGSVWVTDWQNVSHFAADGTQIPFPSTRGQNGPNWVSVDPRDRSIWVTDTSEVKHYSPTGELLGTVTYPVYAGLIWDAKILPDGSLWAMGSQGYPLGNGLVHISPDGTCTSVAGVIDLQSFSVNPLDGSVWIVDYGASDGTQMPAHSVGHFAATGSLLWQDGGEYNAMVVAVDPRNGNCWAVGDGTQTYLLSPDAQELGHTDGRDYVTFSATVNPADGTLWLLDETTQLCKVAATGPYSDVPATSWATQAILECSAASIVHGYSDGSYHPLEQITRDQMAVYIARALCGSDAAVPEGPATPSFPDVPATHWAYKQIEYCKAQNIVQGYPDGYQPGTPLDRGQMATFLARVVAPPEAGTDLAGYTPPATPSFSDVSPDFWAYKYVEYVRRQYVAGGYPDGTYQPGGACTRDQMAVFMARAFHLFR